MASKPSLKDQSIWALLEIAMEIVSRPCLKNQSIRALVKIAKKIVRRTCLGDQSTVKLLISARAAIHFRRALDPAAVGAFIIQVYNSRHFSNSVSPYTRRLLDAGFY